MRYTHYIITDTRTDKSWAEKFIESDARFIRVPYSADGMNAEQARAFVHSMNIAQANHLSEYRYSLPASN